MSSDVPALVDHLFRRNAARITATLARVLGADRLDLAEDVVQEAMAKALAQWPFGGIPDDPAAWLFRVARNQAIDRLRRETNFRDKERAIVDAFSAREETSARFSHELEDDDLQMMLMCCDPQLPPETRLALTLKIVCGCSVDEIARALLAKPEAIAQRLVRAKRFLRDNAIEFEQPSRDELPRRLDSLLDVVYLMFNEGYAATAGDDLVRRDLVDEAIRLAEELAGHEATSLPKVHALAALMHLQRARLATRVDAAGDLLLLEEQDRSRWDQQAIARGLQHFGLAASCDELTRFHVEAAIAVEHLTEPANWDRILELYDDLMQLAPSPVVALNRAVAVAMVEGAECGLAVALALADDLRDYIPLYSTIGELARRAGNSELARRYFEEGAERARTLPLKRWFAKRAK
ncbi:MAG TPA: sigma-70 family RNA polymerase sigma factor [Thermoanaerobaculia bacterium]|nr:sigma-70 family RNA polymerase sigma factor [Thermoanaerobaculia bacterium]